MKKEKIKFKDIDMKKQANNFQMPHVFIILFGFLAFIAILTYFVPAGEFLRIEGPDGRMMIDPNSFHIIESKPVSFLDFLVAIPKGFVEASLVIALTFCIGGGFVIVKRTGIIESAVNNLAIKLSDKGIIIIPVLMSIFAIIDAFIGMPELCLVYVPIIVPLALALGFDKMTAAAIALIGSAAGFTAALTNPFTVGIGQKISGLPLYSGVGYRLIILVIMLSVGIIFVLRYARKIQQNPKLSSVYEENTNYKKHKATIVKISKREAWAGIGAVIVFCVLIFGIFMYGWDMLEIGAMFILMGIVSGVIARLSANKICEAFIEGCNDVLVGALIVGMARGITVIMSESMIMDTIINYLANSINGLPSYVASVGMLGVQTLFNFLMPSGSGQTLITMPIMAPLADLVGVTRQTAVLALQIGDGFSNIIYPTSGYFMASLALAGVTWNKWVKFMFPLFVIWSILGAIFLIIAQLMKWGPF